MIGPSISDVVFLPLKVSPTLLVFLTAYLYAVTIVGNFVNVISFKNTDGNIDNRLFIDKNQSFRTPYVRIPFNKILDLQVF